MAARAATHVQFPLHVLAAELRDTSDRLDVLTSDDPYSDLRAVLSWSYHTLTPWAARLFRLLGLHPGPDLSMPAAASLAGLPASQVRPLLAELARANLIVEHTPGRYTFHDLLHAYATDLARTTDPTEQRHAATHRMLDHYLHTAYTAERLYPALDPIILTAPQPGSIPESPTDHDQALAWFTAEHPVLLAMVEHAAATGFDTHTWQLAWALWTYLHRCGHWYDWVTAGRAAVAATQRLADPAAEADAHRYLAHAYTRLGRFDDAHTHLQHALDLATRIGDVTGQAHTHIRLAYVWGLLRGRYAEAIEHAQQALELHRATDHQRGQAIALNAVGRFHARLGDHQQALACCEQALTVHQELDDRDGQADTWESLGYAQHHLGRYTQAVISYHHAITLYRDLGNRYQEADTLTHLGDTHHSTGNHHAAHDAWQRALTILDELNHPDAGQLRTKLATLDVSTLDPVDTHFCQDN